MSVVAIWYHDSYYMQVDVIFGLVVLIFSAILHEVAHGYMANYLGDPTARLQGRLTLNPLVHIDPIGSIILPLFLRLSGSPILIGYAKPVPYNPYNLRGKYGEALVAFAGPATNIVIALIFGLFIRFGAYAMSTPLVVAFGTIVYINMLLALFNLIPIPPLDGSKVFSAILPRPLQHSYGLLRQNFERLGTLSGTLLILVVFYVLSPYFAAFLGLLFGLLVGKPF
jgi:Zn-dependent protease